MAIIIHLQIIRRNTKYESFRITIPKAIIESHGLKDKDFKLEVKGNKIIFTPVKSKLEK